MSNASEAAVRFRKTLTEVETALREAKQTGKPVKVNAERERSIGRLAGDLREAADLIDSLSGQTTSAAESTESIVRKMLKRENTLFARRLLSRRRRYDQRQVEAAGNPGPASGDT